jgi:CheY-like chemotaxis protein
MNATMNRPVLVVDDERDLRETLCEVLESDGYTVLQAQNGKEALALALQTEPCLILLDLMMPVMSGWQMMEALVEDGRLSSTPVVVVSASHDAPKTAQAFLPKPFELDALLATVERFAGGSRRQH